MCLRKNKLRILKKFHLKEGCVIGLLWAFYFAFILEFHPEFPCFISSCSVGNPKSALPHGIPANVLPWLYVHCLRSHCFRLIYRSHNVTCCRITVYLTQGFKQMPSFFDRRKKHSTLDTCSQHSKHMPALGALSFLDKAITSEKYFSLLFQN